MADKFQVYSQGLSEDLSKSTGDYESLDRGEMGPGQLLDLLGKVKDLAHPDYSTGEDLCPPAIVVKGPAGEFTFIVGDGEIHSDEAGVKVGPAEAVTIVTGEKSPADKAVEARKASGAEPPPMRADLPPTHTIDIEKVGINTSPSTPQVSQKVWKTPGWRDSALTMLVLGIVFLFLPGLILAFAEGGKNAGSGAVMSLVGVAVALLYIPIKVLGQEVMRVGFDWNTNTLWIARKSGIYYEPDANTITGFALEKKVSGSGALFVGGDPAAIASDKEKEWGLKAVRQGVPNPMWVDGSFTASHGQGKKLLAKVKELHDSQF